ncbi:MAG TPA: hypothetical protein VMV45_15435 [Casimicrobiaceae bacterium]|nr:hypothetical protein [Casimicrobiaceae bacterium]
MFKFDMHAYGPGDEDDDVVPIGDPDDDEGWDEDDEDDEDDDDDDEEPMRLSVGDGAPVDAAAAQQPVAPYLNVTFGSY